MGACVFSASLGLASVGAPLLALEASYSAVGVGLLVATSAVSQMAVRLVLGRLLRMFPDRTLIVVAGIAMVTSNLLVVVSAAVVPFVGLADAAGRRPRAVLDRKPDPRSAPRESAIGALAVVNLASGVGWLIGPLLGGVLAEDSARTAMAVGAGLSAVGIAIALFLERLPAFAPKVDSGAGRVWLRPGVAAGCWASVTSGGWLALLGSYVPVALSRAGQNSSTIGILLTVTNAASMLGSAVAGLVQRRGTERWYAAATLICGGGMAFVGVVADDVWLSGVFLALSGIGGGVLQTFGPALVSDAVDPEERGDAIAAAGTFRAVALLAVPLGVAGLLGVLPLAAAMAVASAAITLPASLARTVRGANTWAPAAVNRPGSDGGSGYWISTRSWSVRFGA